MANGNCSICNRYGKLRRGWCGLHYQRWQKYGDPELVTIILGDDRTRFESKVDRSGGPNACHLWQGTLTSDGYGQFWMAGATRRAHAVAWEFVNGPLPVDLDAGRRFDIDHNCHNEAVSIGLCYHGICIHRRCCNENHLIAKKLSFHNGGSAQWLSKLTESQVKEIRASLAVGETGIMLAQRFNVSRATISMINTGKSWKSV